MSFDLLQAAFLNLDFEFGKISLYALKIDTGFNIKVNVHYRYAEKLNEKVTSIKAY